MLMPALVSAMPMPSYAEGKDHLGVFDDQNQIFDVIPDDNMAALPSNIFLIFSVTSPVPEMIHILLGSKETLSLYFGSMFLTYSRLKY